MSDEPKNGRRLITKVLVGTNKVYIPPYFLQLLAQHICENIRPLIRYFPRLWTNLRDLRRVLFCLLFCNKLGVDAAACKPELLV